MTIQAGLSKGAATTLQLIAHGIETEMTGLLDSVEALRLDCHHYHHVHTHTDHEVHADDEHHHHGLGGDHSSAEAGHGHGHDGHHHHEDGATHAEDLHGEGETHGHDGHHHHDASHAGSHTVGANHEDDHHEDDHYEDDHCEDDHLEDQQQVVEGHHEDQQQQVVEGFFTTVATCWEAAKEHGLKIGSPSWPFLYEDPSWPVKGCFYCTSTHHSWPNTAFFCPGTVTEMITPLDECNSVTRLDSKHLVETHDNGAYAHHYHHDVHGDCYSTCPIDSMPIESAGAAHASKSAGNPDNGAHKSPLFEDDPVGMMGSSASTLLGATESLLLVSVMIQTVGVAVFTLIGFGF